MSKLNSTCCRWHVGDFVHAIFAKDGVQVDATVLYFMLCENLQPGLHTVEDSEDFPFGETPIGVLHFLKPVPQWLGDILIKHGEFEPVGLIGQREIVQFG